MKILSKNTIYFPENGIAVQRIPEGLNPKIKRISADDVIPVVLEVTGGDGTSISSGDFIHPGSFISEKFIGRAVGAPSSTTDTFELTLTDGKVWNDFSTSEIDFFVSTPGKIRRVSGNGVFPIVLEYNSNVNPENLDIDNYIYYNSLVPGEEIFQLTPRKIIAHDRVLKYITIGDFLINDPDTHLINFDYFPASWTSNWNFSTYVQIIQTVESDLYTVDEFEVYYEIMGKRTENIILYLDWNFKNSTVLKISPYYYGYFYPDKVASWYSTKEIYRTTNYYADTIEDIAVDTSSFVERTIEIPGEYRLLVPLNVPASVRFIKLLITTNIAEPSGEVIIDIKENTIGFRN